MFTFYQNFNARREENELQREADSTGHDRFCQHRPGAASRRKRRGLTNRRTQSAIEIECNNDAFASVRSVLLRKEKSASIEEDESGTGASGPTAPQPAHEEDQRGYYQLTSKIDSLAKILFNRVYAVKGYKDQADAQSGARTAWRSDKSTRACNSCDDGGNGGGGDGTNVSDANSWLANVIRFWRRPGNNFRGGGDGDSGRESSGCREREPDESCSRNNGRQQYTALDQQHQYQHQHQHQQQQQQQQQQQYHHRHGCESSAGATAAGASATESSAESMEMEKRSRDRALSICRIYTRETPRYSLLKHLNNVGSRVDKHWFVVRDTLLKTDRLLTLAPLNRNCTLSICPVTRDVLNKLFLTLQHPYICPILDLEFVQYESQDYVVLVQPINQGSLKDIIYGIERNCWNEDWSHKYGSRGKGLPISQIQRMGRQILEALVFLKERDFPTVAHLHSGNVIVQNGVARLAALENSLLGFTSRVHPIVAVRLQATVCPRSQLVPESIDTVCFGHMLFEMTAGYELCTFEPTAVNLSDIQKYPQVLECLKFIFERQTQESRYPSIEELILHDLFRNIDLREMRNASVNIFRPDTTIPISKILDGIKCQKTPVKRLSDIDSEDMISLSSPESDRSESGSLLAQIYKELSITSV